MPKKLQALLTSDDIKNAIIGTAASLKPLLTERNKAGLILTLKRSDDPEVFWKNSLRTDGW